MDLSGKLKMAHGRWLAANCGSLTSEKNCKLVIMAPEGQKEDLLDAAVVHAVKTHGHKEDTQLRKELGKHLETVDI